MKVKIVKASNNTYWYSDRIGEIYEVENCSGHRFQLKGNPLTILKEDCEIVDEKKENNKVCFEK